MNTGRQARKVVYPAVFGALALVILSLGAVIPTGAWGIAAAAGLLPAAVFLSVGLAAGLLCWAGVTVLAFLLLPDKFMALLFGVLFGIYPILKGLIEKLRKLPLEYLLKLVFFNLSLTVLCAVMRETVFSSLPPFLGAPWALYLVGNVVFLVYDFGMTRLISLYMARVHRHVRPDKGGSKG